jgi:hypothetical protein
MDVFMSYFPQFWDCWAIYEVRDTQYMFERCQQKLVVFACYCRFHEQFPTVLGFRGDLQGSWDPVHVWEALQKLLFFCCFRELLPTIFWLRCNLKGPWDPIHVWEVSPKPRHFYFLWPFLWDIAHSFGIPARFTRTMRPYISLRGVTKNSSFSCSMAIFMSYCP